MFTGLSDGTVDAVLELWPRASPPTSRRSSTTAPCSTSVSWEPSARSAGSCRSYVIDEHPDLATWEGFADPANAALFATAETGDQGRFLGTDPSYSQYDEAIIANLDLPFQVVFSGSEPATVAELDARVAAQEPIVMYWWTPTAAVAKYDLVNVAAPRVLGGVLCRSGSDRL